MNLACPGTDGFSRTVKSAFSAACCSIDDENRRIDPDLVADEDMTRNGQTERARGSAQQHRIHDDEHEGDDLKRATCAAGEGLVQEDQACGDRTAFVVSVAIPAAVTASPCWKADWSRIEPRP